MVESITKKEEESTASAPKMIDPSLWTVSVYRSVEGGGTGQEFYTNLQKPGDGPGNKWYDCQSGETWIQADFKKPQPIKMIGLKSANDCPERDPAHIIIQAKNENDKEWKNIEEIDDLEFSSRYEQQDIFIFPDYYISIRILIKKNKSFQKYNHWGTGTQLAEFILFS